MQHGDPHGPASHDAHDAHAGGHGRAPRSAAETFFIPLAIPVACVLGGAAVIFLISQILLATGDASAPIALLVAIAILLTAAYFASARTLKSGQVLAGVAVPAVILLVAGLGSGFYSLNHKSSASAGLPPPPPQVTTDDKFSVTSFKVPAGVPVSINITNQGQATHNMHILGVQDPSGNEYKTALLTNGQTATLTFTIAQPGTYKFQCDVHPTEMFGTITVVPAPPSAGGTPSPNLSETTTDDKYSSTALTAAAGTKTTMTVDNKGAALHNWHILDATNADGSAIKTDLAQPGSSASVTFEIDKPGTYHFQCDVHPTEMTGTITVK